LGAVSSFCLQKSEAVLALPNTDKPPRFHSVFVRAIDSAFTSKRFGVNDLSICHNDLTISGFAWMTSTKVREGEE